jgi:hypothetical protein
MRQIRTALNAYHNITAWRSAQRSLNAEALSKFYADHVDLVNYMEYIWKLQEDQEEE